MSQVRRRRVARVGVDRVPVPGDVLDGRGGPGVHVSGRRREEHARETTAARLVDLTRHRARLVCESCARPSNLVPIFGRRATSRSGSCSRGWFDFSHLPTTVARYSFSSFLSSIPATPCFYSSLFTRLSVQYNVQQKYSLLHAINTRYTISKLTSRNSQTQITSPSHICSPR